MALFNENSVFNGLGTYSRKILEAGNYFVEGKINLPTFVNGGGASSLVVTINQNGSPIYTGAAGADGFKVEANCAVNDLIAIVLTSSAPADQEVNGLKTTVSIGLGE